MNHRKFKYSLTFQPSGRPIASSQFSHFTSETSLAAWWHYWIMKVKYWMVGIEKYWILVKLWHLRSFETLAAASLLNGNLLNASVEYVPVLRRYSSMNAYRPVKGADICMWFIHHDNCGIHWHVVENLSPPPENLLAWSQVVEHFFNLRPVRYFLNPTSIFTFFE